LTTTATTTTTRKQLFLVESCTYTLLNKPHHAINLSTGALLLHLSAAAAAPICAATATSLLLLLLLFLRPGTDFEACAGLEGFHWKEI